MTHWKKAIQDAIVEKKHRDIVIIGKGPSIDTIDLSLIKDCIIINTNDSEQLVSGDIAVFHHGWVLDIFDDISPSCKLYISDKKVPGQTTCVYAEYVPYTPESAEFLLHRFFSDTLYTEHAVVVTALRVANEIANITGERKNVYLLGFDFTAKDGYTRKIQKLESSKDTAFIERVLNSQEQLLQMMIAEKRRLSINIFHVGNKPYSFYSAEAFNKLYAVRHINVTSLDVEDKTIEKKADNGVKIVAEITTNHFGDMDRLKSMIISAKLSGADYVKLQKRSVESFYASDKLDSPYLSPFGKTFRDYRLGIELDREKFQWVDQFCKEIGIGWFASILDAPSYTFIQEFEPEMIKLPSTISEHTDYLAAVAADFTKDIVISTGYTDEAYEDFILNTFKRARNIYLLQCVSAYPCENTDAQVGVVRHYYNLSKSDSRIIPGFSSHDIGSLCSMMAVAAGARMIEKHVKLGDVTWSHFDEVAVDLANGDFERFVRDIRMAERIVGEETKIIHTSEHHKYWLQKSAN